MKQVIYVDVLVAVNLFVNYFLLLGTAKLFSLSVKRYRLLLAAALGAVYSLYILLPALHILFNGIVKLAMSVTIVLVAFGFRSRKVFLKTTVCFYAINFAFAGIMAALWYLCAPTGLVLNNGVVYFNISPILLVGATLICYLAVRMIQRFTGQQIPKELFCEVVISSGNTAVYLRAKVDTENSLIEPFSHLPSIVAEYQTVASLIPEEARSLFQPQMVMAGVNNENKKNLAWFARCRMVPFQAVSGKGVLPAFRPDWVEIRVSGQASRKQAYIAVCEKGMFQGEYSALMNPQLLD